jgi:hypothetical protein
MLKSSVAGFPAQHARRPGDEPPDEARPGESWSNEPTQLAVVIATVPRRR